MSDMTINPNPTTDAEYQTAIDQLLADMNFRFAQMDVTRAEAEQIRANTERLAAANAIALREIKAALSALRR